MISPASVKAQLKNLAQKTGSTMQDKLSLYALERTLYRLSISPYADSFVLKGGILLYGLLEGDFLRATRDIDLLGMNIANDKQTITSVFRALFAIESDDALQFDLDTLAVKTITEFKKYSGINVSITAFLDRTRIPVSIDIGFGDRVYPDADKLDFPTLLNMDGPILSVYSLDSVIAEKFEAIVDLGWRNSRYKDFYDIYLLSLSHDFDGFALQQAIHDTFHDRQTTFSDLAAFTDEFSNDRVNNARWKTFIQRKTNQKDLPFGIVIDHIKTFLLPVVDGLRSGIVFTKHWSSENKCWMD